MFDYENLKVYQKAKNFNKGIIKLLTNKKYDRHLNDQLKRASLSIMLNIAVGTAQKSKAARRNYYLISRGSVYECAAIFDFLHETNYINKEEKLGYYQQLEEISKMLYALIGNLERG